MATIETSGNHTEPRPVNNRFLKFSHIPEQRNFALEPALILSYIVLTTNLNKARIQVMYAMSFIHTPSTKHPEILISHCNLCGCLVGASPRHSLIATVEAAHHCSGKLKPVVRTQTAAPHSTDKKRLPS